MNIASLRKKAKANSLEVEDILAIAVKRPPGLVEELAGLSAECNWVFEGLAPDGTRVVPLAEWAAMASAYAVAGFSGLKQYVREEGRVRFALSLAEEVKTNESVEFVLDISRIHVVSIEDSTEIAFRVAAAFNLLLSFRPAAPVTADQAIQIQSYLFTIYPFAQSEAERAGVLLALRGVGNDDAIRFAEAAREFAYPWEQTKKSTLQALRKRAKQVDTDRG